MGKFRSLLIKQQYLLKIQVYNVCMLITQAFLNHEEDLLEKLREGELMMSCWDLELYLANWGLGQSQIDVALKEYYDKTGKI